MKTAHAVMVGALSMWVAGCCGGAPGFALAPEDASFATGELTLRAGGARAAFLVLSAAGAVPSGLTLTSSDPSVVEVVAAPDAGGRSVVRSGQEGTATLTLTDSGNAVLDTLNVSVRPAARLVPRFADGQTKGHAIAKEVVALRIEAMDGNGARLYGSGLLKSAVTGTGAPVEGAIIDGVDRVLLTGSVGEAIVRVELQALTLEAAVAFANPNVATAVDHATDAAGCAETTGPTCLPRPGVVVSIDVRGDGHAALAGGQCQWTAVGAELATDFSHVDDLALTTGPRTATFLLPAGRGSASATCTLGGVKSTVVLR